MHNIATIWSISLHLALCCNRYDSHICTYRQPNEIMQEHSRERLNFHWLCEQSKIVEIWMILWNMHCNYQNKLCDIKDNRECHTLRFSSTFFINSLLEFNEITSNQIYPLLSCRSYIPYHWFSGSPILPFFHHTPNDISY